MASPSQFIGSKISLISKSEIRYEGILYSLDLIEATISLAKVKSFGTEDRPTERPVPAKEQVYEFIIFRGSDIKGIDVVEPPKTTATTLSGGLTNDPAIIEVSHYHTASAPAAPAPAPAPIPGQQSAFQGRYSGGNVFGGGQGSKGQQSELKVTPPRSQHQQEREQEQPQQQQQQQQQQHGQESSFFDGLIGTRRESPSTDAGVQVGQSNSRQGQNRGQGQGQGQQQQHHQQNQRGMNNNYRGQRGGGQQRGGYRGNYRGGNRVQGQPGQPAQAKVTFDQEFDFEKANEELLDALVKIKIKDEEIAGTGKEENEVEESSETIIFYQKDNFFDNISCEALEAGKGRRPDWKAERKLNAETFGLTRGGGGRGGWRGGYGGGGYRRGYQQQSWGGYNYNRGYQRRGQGHMGGGGGGQYRPRQQQDQERQY